MQDLAAVLRANWLRDRGIDASRVPADADGFTNWLIANGHMQGQMLDDTLRAGGMGPETQAKLEALQAARVAEANRMLEQNFGASAPQQVDALADILPEAATRERDWTRAASPTEVFERDRQRRIRERSFNPRINTVNPTRNF